MTKRAVISYAAAFLVTLIASAVMVPAGGLAFPPPDDGDVYTVQIGAYRHFENAKKSFEALQALPDIRVQSIGGYYVLRAGLFENRSEGVELLETIRGGYADSFILNVSYSGEGVLLPRAGTLELVGKAFEGEFSCEASVGTPVEAAQAEAPQAEVLMAAETISEEAALAAEGEGDWERAARMYEALLAAGPGRADLWVRLSDIEAKQGNAAVAAEALSEAARITPADAAVHYKLSRAYAVADRPKDALLAINRALELEPQNAGYVKAKAALASWNGDYDAAAQSYKKLLSMNPEDYDALLNKARNDSWAGRLDVSASGYRKYLKKDPAFSEALLEYAKVQSWRGNYAASAELLVRYRKKFGQTPEYEKQMAQVLSMGDRPEEALEILPWLLGKSPRDYELNYARTVAYHYGGFPELAVRMLGRTAALRPGTKEAQDLGLFINTPLRSHIRATGRAYHDSDDLDHGWAALEGAYFVKPGTRVTLEVRGDILLAEPGSGLEHIDGSEEAVHYRLMAGLEHRVSSKLTASARVGFSHAEDSSTMPYNVAVQYRPSDSLRLSLERDYGFFVLSPRTVSLHIKRGMNRARATWTPSMRYVVVAEAGYDMFSDGNSRWEAVVAPRRVFFRTERLNLDLGLRASAFGFRHDYSNGYYDPELYQRYEATSFGYLKINDQAGLGVVATAGVQKDDTMDSFRFGWSLEMEGTAGIFHDWMLRVRLSAMENLRETGAFKGYAVGADLTRRL